MTSHFCKMPTFKTAFRTSAALASLVILSSSAAAESVGRTEVDLSAQAWSHLTTFQSTLKFDGGAHVTPLSTKVFFIPGPTAEPMAVLVITSTDGGTGTNVRWVSETCPPARKHFYSDDFSSDKQGRTRQCLIVNSSFATFAYLKPDSEVVAAAEARSLTLFRSGYSIRSVYSSQGGSLLRVNLMTKKNFAGLPDVDSAALNRLEVPPPLVAWGQALHKAVERSVMSLSGKLELPPISFSQ